jgi:hypothetical protein
MTLPFPLTAIAIVRLFGLTSGAVGVSTASGSTGDSVPESLLAEFSLSSTSIFSLTSTVSSAGCSVLLARVCLPDFLNGGALTAETSEGNCLLLEDPLLPRVDAGFSSGGPRLFAGEEIMSGESLEIGFALEDVELRPLAAIAFGLAGGGVSGISSVAGGGIGVGVLGYKYNIK